MAPPCLPLCHSATAYRREIPDGKPARRDVGGVAIIANTCSTGALATITSSVRRPNWNQRRLGFGSSAFDGSVCMAALCAATWSRSKGIR